MSILENIQIPGANFFRKIPFLFKKENKDGTFRWEAVNYDKVYEEMIYKTLEPVNGAIRDICNGVSQLKLALYDNDDEYIIEEGSGKKGNKGDATNILNKNYNFILNKYSTNGSTNSYQVFIQQIVTNLCVYKEFFLKVKYYPRDKIFSSVQVIPSNLFTHIGTNYVEEFLLAPYGGNDLKQEKYKLIRQNSNIYKRILENNEKPKVRDADVEYYLLHYYETDPLNLSFKLSENGLILDQKIPCYFRGYSTLEDLMPLIRKYAVAETKLLQLIQEATVGKHVVRVANTAEAVGGFKQMHKQTDNITDAEEKEVKASLTQPYAIAKGVSKIDEAYKYFSHDLDFNKTIKPLQDIVDKLRIQIYEALGVPLRKKTTEGSSFNNLAIADEEFEKYCINIADTIATFLTQCMRVISDDFLNENYSIIVDYRSSNVLLKRKEQQLKLLNLTSGATPNDGRDVVGVKPLPGGDELPQSDTGTKKVGELTPEEAVKQKRKTGKNGDWQVPKKSN